MTTEYPGTKTEIRRAVKKIKSESEIIEKIIHALKEALVLSDETLEVTDVDTVVENLDKELSDIMDSVDVSVKAAEDHIKERLLNGENESVLSAVSSSKNSVQSPPQFCPPKLSNRVAPKSCHATPANSQIPQNHAMPPSQSHSVCSSSESSHGIPPISHVIEPQTKQTNLILVVQQKEVQDASERLENLQKEQNGLEKELQKKSEIFELNKQKVKDAQSIVSLNKARVEDSKLSSPTAYKVPPPHCIHTHLYVCQTEECTITNLFW